MRVNELRSRHGLPLLLLALGGSVGVLAWWSLARTTSSAPSPLDTAVSAQGIGEPRPLAADDLSSGTARTAQLRAARAAEPDLSQGEPLRADSERGLRARYLALEAAEPGHLSKHAEAWLSAERPGAEKVAWLQALYATDPEAGLLHLEAACALPDASSPQGEAPAAFALESLVRLAPREASARAALNRVVARTESVDVGLRRRAAATIAALGDAHDIDALAQALLREGDETLRAGVVVALEGRGNGEGRLAAERLLAWLRPGSAAFLARGRDGTP